MRSLQDYSFLFLMKNIAFIDGQNLYLGAAEENWCPHHKKLRTYLRDKYSVEHAYYFLGYVSEDQQNLYKNLQKAGFIVIFKEHLENFKGKKKGNVDTDIVFEVLRNFIEEKFDKIILVSGDGDYKKLVDYLIEKNVFEKILFPNTRFASSLYKTLGAEFYDCLGKETIKRKIRYEAK